MLKEALDQFTAPVYGKLQRNTASYLTMKTYCGSNLERLVQEYSTIRNDQLLLQQIRKDIDMYLRRYHKYCIEERDGMQAHYHEVGADADCDFEHLIPAKRIMDLLLARIITVDQALNAPTVRLSRAKHSALKDAGWESSTPDMWRPFRRYSQVFDAQYQTYDGTPVDTEIWTLQRHFDYFVHLTNR